MLRKLLALLLLVTGLAALGHPAQARGFEVESARPAAAAGYASVDRTGPRIARSTLPSADDATRPSIDGRTQPRQLVVATVRLQADRARE